MNIQLRDSQVLQDFIKKESGRKQLPKPQLHPELLNGVVDCDREGFEIRSEMLTGEHRGDPNPQDVRNLTAFLPDAKQCEARWKIINVKQGDSMMTIPSELVFSFDDGSKLAIHTQAVGDVTKLTSALPTDQIAKFNATPNPENGSVSMVRADSKRIQVSPLSEGELKTQFAIYGLKWDNKASRETAIELLHKAIEKKQKADKELQPA